MISCTHLRQEGPYAPSWYRCPHRRSSPHRLPLSRINVGSHADTECLHYNISIIEMVLEGNEGEGVLAVGVEIEVDEETNTLSITNVSSQPVRLVNIRKTS